jgi:hypothetical protein
MGTDGWERELEEFCSFGHSGFGMVTGKAYKAFLRPI